MNAETNLSESNKLAGASPLKSVAKLAPVDVTEVLTQRGKQYGDFKGQAQVAQDLKSVVKRHLYDRRKELNADQEEALEMFCLKMSRIIYGDENVVDNWVDISGYAQLVADRLRGVTR